MQQIPEKMREPVRRASCWSVAFLKKKKNSHLSWALKRLTVGEMGTRIKTRGYSWGHRSLENEVYILKCNCLQEQQQQQKCVGFSGPYYCGLPLPIPLLIKRWCQHRASFRYKNNQTTVSWSKKLAALEPALQASPHSTPSPESNSGNLILMASCSSRHESRSSWGPIQWITSYNQQKRSGHPDKNSFVKECQASSCFVWGYLLSDRRINITEKRSSMRTHLEGTC